MKCIHSFDLIQLKKIVAILLILIVTLQDPALVVAETVSTQSASATPNTPDSLIQISELNISSTAAEIIDSLENNNANDQVKKLATVKRLGKKNYRGDEKVKVIIDNAEKNFFKLKIKGPKGIDVKARVEQDITDGTKTFTITPPPEFTPGKYTVEVLSGDGEVYSSQEFLWGVLAINTNKSVYKTSETVHLSIAVLDESGNMQCDAKVRLLIINPKGEKKELSTESGEILVNDQCSKKELSLIPDYETQYKTEFEGTHQMILTATTKNGDEIIQDAFDVENNSKFYINRESTTRIYPPNTYPMTFAVTFEEDFKGVITEFVPDSFEVFPASQSATFDHAKTVSKAVTEGKEVLGVNTDITLPIIVEDGKKPENLVSAVFGDVVKDPLLYEKYKKFGLSGHDGIDFDVPIGTPIYATDEGQVLISEEDWDYGTSVVIDHVWGKSYYGHLSELKVERGEEVKKGQLIALSGNTGLSTGPHLHFGIKPKINSSDNGFYGKIDPAAYLGLPDESSVLGATADAFIKVKALSFEVDAKKGETKEFSYFYKTPPQSPQFYKIGPLRFYDENDLELYTEGRQWQLAVDAPTGNAMLIYDEDAANQQAPHNRTWSPSDLSSESNMNTDGTLFADVNHTIVKAAPTRNEYIRAALDESGTLNVQVFDGTSWSFGAGAPPEGNFTQSIGTTNDVNRNFDLTYEDTSGDAMVVYEDSATDNKTLKYRIWDGSAWSAEQTFDYSAVAESGADDEAEWVEVKGRSGGNEIMLGWKPIAGDGIYAAVWDGDSWEDITLINGAGISHVRRSFDIVWEGTSDQGMIVYGTGTTTDHSVYDISAGTWTDGASTFNPGEAVDWLNLAADSATDYIAMIITSGASTSTSDTSVDIWNGSDWTTVTTPSEDTDINTYGFAQSADVAWEATGDRALFAWRDGTTSETALRYMVYDRGSNAFQAIDNNVNCLLTEGGAGTVETVTALANAMDSAGPCSGLGAWAGVAAGIKLAPDPSSSDIMLLASNQATGNIVPEAQLWNGDANGTWLTQTSNMGAFEADASPGIFPTASAPYRAYDFTWREETADNTGLLIYDEDGANVDQPPHYRAWSGTDFGSEANLLDYTTNNSSESVFNILRAAPTRDEYIAGRLTSDGHLNIQIWDGDSWEYGDNAPDLGIFTKSVGSTNAINRSFDIAYEHTSGDAMVVYEDSATANTTLKYRIWDGSAWSSEGTLDYSAVDEGNDNTAWVELTGRPAGNEIMIGWKDETLLGQYAAVWDGDSWEDVVLINGAGVDANHQTFDIDWEGTSDQGMYLYGTGTTTDYSVYDISAGTWTDGSSSVNPGGAVVWARVDADPSSDYIAAIIVDTLSTTSSDIQVDMWNGSDWTTVAVPTADADINTYGFAQGTDVAWEQSNSSGRALFVWRNGIIAAATTAETSLSYMVYDRNANAFQAIDDNSVCLLTEGGAGTTETVTNMDANEDAGGPCNGLGTWAGTVSGIRLYPDPSSNIIAVFAENETTLDVRPEMQLWNGDANGSWLTQTSNMGAFETDASLGTLPTNTVSTLPYAFAFNKSDGSVGGETPTLSQIMRHGKWFNNGVIQPFTF